MMILSYEKYFSNYSIILHTFLTRDKLADYWGRGNLRMTPFLKIFGLERFQNILLKKFKKYENILIWQ